MENVCVEVGKPIAVKCDKHSETERVCWEKFRKLRAEGLQANAFQIKSITLYKDGTSEAKIQPLLLRKKKTFQAAINFCASLMRKFPLRDADLADKSGQLKF